jgi:hypothetical protein
MLFCAPVASQPRAIDNQPTNCGGTALMLAKEVARWCETSERGRPRSTGIVSGR